MRKPLIILLFAGLLLSLGVLRAIDIRTSYDEVTRRVRTRASSDALVLAEYVGGAFAAADAALRQVAVQSRRMGGVSAPSADWEPVLSAARAGLTGVGAISVVDQDLVIRHSTRPDIIGQPRRGDAYIADQLLSGGENLVVGQPFESPVADGFLIPVGRRLTTSGGTLEGVVVASFIPQDLKRFFQSVSVGERGAVWVFHSAGRIVFKEPSPDDPIGGSAEGNAIYAAAASGAPQGLVEGPVMPGGPANVSAFRRVPGLPLIVGVSLDREEMLAPWYRELRGFALTYAVVSAVLVAALVMLFRQIDANAAAERELQQARAQEERRLRDSNAQLAALLEREQAARREAETASALKDQFVMTVSHELRTPLTAIAGWARMLVDGMVAEDKREGALRTIERNAQAQKRLIEDLLDIAGIMNAKLRLEVRPTDVSEVVHNAVDAVMPAASAKSIRLVSSIDPTAGVIAADPERIQQIVWNLLSNAVKFTPNGGEVSLNVVRSERAIHIDVMDSGAGIPADLLPYVFERFRQGSAEPARRQGGLGLGLAIVRNLVELHGGTVSAHSDGEGRGSTFSVSIPAA